MFLQTKRPVFDEHRIREFLVEASFYEFDNEYFVSCSNKKHDQSVYVTL